MDIQWAVSHQDNLPSDREIQTWVESTLHHVNGQRRELTIRVVDKNEIQSLNHQFRDKNSPTNVLAFPFDAIHDVEMSYLGDIVICLPVVETESKQQHKSVNAHFAHMVIHGTLHLCGFDHQTDAQAQEMEAIERLILEEVGFAYGQP